MAAIDALTEGQVSSTSELIREALHECTSGLSTEVQQLQTGMISRINVRIDGANMRMNDVLQQMLGIQEGCRTLLMGLTGESERVSQRVAGRNQINDKIDVVQKALSDW